MMRREARTQIFPLLASLESEYIADAYAVQLEQAFERLRAGFVSVGEQARIVATQFTDSMNATQKQRFYKSIESVIGVDLGGIIKDEGLEDILVASTRENVSLIKSIPEEYFKKIEGLVFRETIQGTSANSMIRQLVKIGQVTDKRARLIARDQSSKLNSALNQQRQQNLGVEEYIWVTSSDERVRDSHRKNNGKKFRWDSPPPETGHPGHDVQCRCIARPIIKL